MELNFDILNYLNMVGERFGEMYSKRNFNPLPEDFKLTNEIIVERIKFKAMRNEISMPQFMYGDKKNIKKCYKISLKNTKKIEKFINLHEVVLKFDEGFKNNLMLYLTLRTTFLKEELRRFYNTSFYEYLSYRQLIEINPAFAIVFEDSFSKSFNIANFVEKLEENYKNAYSLLEEKIKDKLDVPQEEEKKAKTSSKKTTSKKTTSKKPTEKGKKDEPKKIKLKQGRKYDSSSKY